MDFQGPIAIRYPRGTAYAGLPDCRQPIELGRAEWLYREKEIALFAVGSMVEEAVKVRELLKQAGHQVSLVNARFVKPIDEEVLEEAAKEHSLIVTMEENVACGGYGEKVLDFANRKRLPYKILTIRNQDDFVRRVELLDLFQSQHIFSNAQARNKDTVFYLKEVEVCP